MRLQIFSDIHAEAYMKPENIWKFITPFAPIALVAGDIDSRKFEATVTEIASKFEHVICVLGNHEFYHKKITWRPDPLKMPDNVHILDQSTFELDGVLFMGCTLWTDFNNADWFLMQKAKMGINDFNLITTEKDGNYYKFTPHMALDLHKEEKKWLEDTLDTYKSRTGKTVVMTHFMPSLKLVHPYWWENEQRAALNPYFAANCDELIAKSDADLWVFGHTHNARDEDLGGARCICNPYGYPGENKDIFQNIVVEI